MTFSRNPEETPAEGAALPEAAEPEAQQPGTVVNPFVTTGVRTYPVQEEPLARFNMMGVEFAQGLCADKSYESDASEASYNIGGQYSKMTFTVGHVDGRENSGRTPEIYLDEKLYDEIPLDGNMMNLDVTMDVTGITKVRFWWKGHFGIGNILCW